MLSKSSVIPSKSQAPPPTQLNLWAEPTDDPPALTSSQPSPRIEVIYAGAPPSDAAPAAEPVVEPPTKLSLNDYPDVGVQKVNLSDLRLPSIAQALIDDALREFHPNKRRLADRQRTIDIDGTSFGLQDKVMADMLVWIFDMQPDTRNDTPDFPFGFACELAAMDGEMLRRVVARNMQKELCRTLKMVSYRLGAQYSADLALELSSYVDLSDWENA